MARGKRLVTQHLENISWKVLDSNPELIRDMIRGKAGVYALYRRDKLYYVGLATNLMTRLKQHLKDRHSNAWDRFSVYLTLRDEHIKELESLLLRIVGPAGNKQAGNFVNSENLRPQLNRQVRDYYADKRAELLGGRVARTRIKNKARNARAREGLKGILTKRMTLKGWRGDYEYTASARKDGTIRFGNEIFDTPNSAARGALGRSVRGWHFWHYKNASGEWVKLINLKKGRR